MNCPWGCLLPLFENGWHRSGPPIFGNIAEHLLPSEQMRGAFLLAWLGSMVWLFVRHKDGDKSLLRTHS